MSDDDEDERQLIAKLFEQELLELNATDYDDEDEANRQLRDLEDLSKQLRSSLRLSDDETAFLDGDTEWAAMVESSNHAAARLNEMDYECAIASSESEEMKRRWTDLEDLRLKEAHLNMTLNSLANNATTTPAAKVSSDEHHSDNIEGYNIVKELMGSMLDSVEYTWKIVISKEREVAHSVVIDLSKLPKIISDDVEEGTDMSAYTSGLNSYNQGALSISEQLEREHLQESIRIMNDEDAETILLKEAEEAALILEEDKQQRLHRKLRMMEEILRAKQNRSAIRVQAYQRGIRARNAVSCLRAQRKLDAEREAERTRIQLELELEKKRIQKEIEEKRREFAAEKRELEEMRDEDILSMQVQNWENLLREREEQRKFAEREAERFLAEENLKSGPLFEEMEQSNLTSEKSHTSDEVHNKVDELKLKMAPSELADNAPTEEEKVAMDLLEDPWTRFGDADEEAILKSQSPMNTAKPKAISSTNKSKKTSQKKTTRKGSDSDSDIESNGGNEDDEDEEIGGQQEQKLLSNVSKTESSVLPFMPDFGRVLPLSLSREESAKNSLVGVPDLLDFWSSLATGAICSSSNEVMFESTGVNAASQLFQKKANVLRLEILDPAPAVSHSTERSIAPNGSETPSIISPRAKIGGMRLVASRVSPRSGICTDKAKNAIMKMKEFDKENEVIRRRLAAQDTNRKSLYQFILADEKIDPIRKKDASNRVFDDNPLLCALDSWRAYCEDEHNLLQSSLAQSSTSQSLQDTHGFDSPMAQHTPAPNSKADDEKIRQYGLKRDTTAVKSIELNVEGLHSCSFLRNYANATRVELNVNRLCSLDGLKYMARLEELSVKDNALTDIGALRYTTALQTLSLDSNRLTELSPLCHLSRLQNLTANTNNISTMPLLTASVQLQRLELYQNQICEIPIDSFKHLTNLTHLDLGRNRLEYIDGSALSHCVLLQSLVLSQNKLTEVPSPLYLPQLKTLWLSGNRLETLSKWLPTKVSACVNPRGWSAFGFESHGTSAHAVHDNSAEMEVLYNWSTFMPMLEKLYLQDNALYCANRSALLCLPNLMYLDLSFNLIETTSNLGVTGCPKLRTLQIQENPISTSTAGTGPLYLWLISQCPSLNAISGDEFSESARLSELKSSAANQSERDQSLASFLDHGSWENSLDRFSEGLNDKSPSSSSGLSSFLQLLASLQAEHAVFDALLKNSKKNTQGHQSLDSAYLDMLKQQVLAMLKWSDSSPECSRVSHMGSAYFVNYKSFETEPRESTQTCRYAGKNNFQVRKAAATVIQALLRGYRTRCNISKALAAVEYKDDEIDEIDAMLKSMDFGVSQMDLEYISQKPMSSKETLTATLGNNSLLIQNQVSKFTSESPMVYGDHRRTKRSSDNAKSADFLLPPHQSAAGKTGDDIPPHLSSWMSENVAKIRLALTGEGGTGGVPVMSQSPRPTSAMSESSTITEGSLPVSAQGRALESIESPFRNSNSGISRDSSIHQVASETTNSQIQMAQEWGISDPKVVALMMKRNNRLSGVAVNSGIDAIFGGAGSNSKRKIATTTTISGSFGGAKKTLKSTKRGSRGPPPAWAREV